MKLILWKINNIHNHRTDSVFLFFKRFIFEYGSGKLKDGKSVVRSLFLTQSISQDFLNDSNWSSEVLKNSKPLSSWSFYKDQEAQKVDPYFCTVYLI